jgi:hypothetical protein
VKLDPEGVKNVIVNETIGLIAGCSPSDALEHPNGGIGKTAIVGLLVCHRHVATASCAIRE